MTQTLPMKVRLVVATLAIALASLLAGFVADDKAGAVSVYVDGVYHGDYPDESLNACALGTSGCVPVKYK